MERARDGVPEGLTNHVSPPNRCFCGRSSFDACCGIARLRAGALHRARGPLPGGVACELHGRTPADLRDPPRRRPRDRELGHGHTVTVRAVAVGGLVAQAAVHVTVAGGQSADRQTLLAQTTRYRAVNWQFQSLMRVAKTPSAPLRGTLVELVLWRSRASAARLRAGHPPHYDQWMCIHSHEAAWTSHDSGHNGHYGGLQMSFDFMRGYGPELYAAKGTADHWTPLEQIWVAERAWKVRGYNPWPTTARMCGLLR